MAISMNSSADKTLPSATPLTHHWYVVVFIISFALDFKGSAGGSPIQYLMAGLNSVAFLLLAVNYRMVLPRKVLGAFIFWGWLVFLMVGTVGALVNTIPLGRYIRTIYPFILFLEGFLVAWWAAKKQHDAEIIVSAMMATAIVSLFFTLFWGFYFTGKGLGEIRYQILSPLFTFIVVVSAYDLFFTRRRSMRSFVLIIIAGVLTGISVTRTIFLVLGFVAVIILIATFINALSTGTFPKVIIRTIGWILMVGLICITITTLFYPDIIGRWAGRVLGEARSVTFWTRVAAVNGQLQALTSSPFGWLTGQGFGNSYSWIFSGFDWIISYLGRNCPSSYWFPGEFMWMTFLFYGGFVIGPIAASVLLAGAVYTFRLLLRCLRTQSWRDPQSLPLWIGMLGFVSFLGNGFTANPLGSRNTALFMGLCLGLVVVQKSSILRGHPRHLYPDDFGHYTHNGNIE